MQRILLAAADPTPSGAPFISVKIVASGIYSWWSRDSMRNLTS